MGEISLLFSLLFRRFFRNGSEKECQFDEDSLDRAHFRTLLEDGACQIGVIGD